MGAPSTVKIYYSGNQYPTYYVGAPVKRWDEGNWDLTMEIFVESSNRNNLFAHTTPGAVRELYNILGTPKYIDTTYASANTLIIEPQYPFGISSLREKRVIGVKSISDTIINPNYFHIKIEGLWLDVE